MMFRFRDEAAAKKIVDSITDYHLKLDFMHVCGTHQDTLVRFGLEEMIHESGVNIRQGPGCPVCVTTSREIIEAITLAENGITLAVFGDMMKVPTPRGSLGDAKAKGADVRIVYSIEDAVKIAQEGRKVTFMGIGFETTSPTTAAVMVEKLPKSFSVLSCHRALPPALDAILQMGDFKIDGLIEPGHVSAIIGLEPYKVFSERYHIPQVVGGFEPLDMLMSVYMLVKQIVEERAEVENEYSRLVKPEGNLKAKALLKQVFRPVDRAWRGFPVIPKSALELKPEYDAHNARVVYENLLQKIGTVKDELGGCRCGEVLRGLITSEQCPAFGKGCTPNYPMGPCMVSREGSCNISYRYRKT